MSDCDAKFLFFLFFLIILFVLSFIDSNYIGDSRERIKALEQTIEAMEMQHD